MLRSARFGVVLLALVAGAAQAAPLQNGSFENTNGASDGGWGGGYTYGAGYSTMADWSVTFGSVDIVSDNISSGWGMAHSGDHFLDLNGWGGGGIQQSFDTTVGTQYTVDFWYRRNTQSAPGAAVAVGVAAPVVGGPSGLIFQSTDTLGNWQMGSFGFVASVATTTLSFSSLVYGYTGGVFLDTVSVTAVPEPAALLLALAGIGIVGLARQRSRDRAEGESALRGA